MVFGTKVIRAALMVGALGMAPTMQCQAGGGSVAPKEQLRCGVSTCGLSSALERYGVTCLVEGDAQHFLLVDKVRPGSAGFYKGLNPGDRIEKLSQDKGGLVVTLVRGSHRYRVEFEAEHRSKNQQPQWLADMSATLQAARPAILQPQEKQIEDNGLVLPEKVALGGYPFSRSDVSKGGKAVIAQSGFPNCWFLSAVDAVLKSPGGATALSKLILPLDANNNRVTFLTDPLPVEVLADDLKQSDLRDKTAWAKILDYACLKKWSATPPSFIDGTA